MLIVRVTNLLAVLMTILELFVRANDVPVSIHIDDEIRLGVGDLFGASVFIVSVDVITPPSPASS